MNIHSYRSNVNGRTAEHNLANGVLTIFEAGSILVELDVPRGATAGEIWNHIEADYDAMNEEAEAIIAAVVIETAAPKMKLSPRYNHETYSLRGHSGRKSDRVTRYSRKINGKAFEFSKIQWGVGGTTIRAYQAGTANILHEIQY